jgi:hypothetical protein
MSAVWTITAPSGSGTVQLSEAEAQTLACVFRIMATSTAQLMIHRDYDAADDWWVADEVVTICRAASEVSGPVPYFTGRVLETPISANGQGEYRQLQLADGWQDLEDIVYQEAWGIGSGSVLIPKAVLGLNQEGVAISTGQQISAAVAYAITEGAAMALGTIDDGPSIWPSEVTNISCADVILGELRWTPDWAAWLDHSTQPPTFHARAKSALTNLSIDIADEGVGDFEFAKLVRTIPRGVRLLYEDASIIDGEVYRNGYLDTDGETTGRKIMHATIELAGMNVQHQKSRIETRTLPTDGATMKAYFKKKWPELKDMPDAGFEFSNVSFAVAPLDAQPDVICQKAPRLEVTTVEDIPRELVRGQIEDWMRKKVGQVTVQYDLKINGVPNKAQRKILDNFTGEGKSFTVTATNAITKLYKGISSFTEGEEVPEGIAASVYAAATADKYEGTVTIVAEDAPATRWMGRTVSLYDGVNEQMPPMVVHSASVDVDAGTVTLSYGPLPYLSAGDFLELQRMVNSRPVTWWSQEERASNQIGAEAHPGSKGDTVAGFDLPGIISPPGGAPPEMKHPWKVKMGDDAEDEGIKEWEFVGGTVYSQGASIFVADGVVTGGSGFVVLKTTRNSSSRALTSASVEWQSAVATSDEDTQYRVLAKVNTTTDPLVLQLQVEEIRIWELMLVENGEFRLNGMEHSHRNSYEPAT